MSDLGLPTTWLGAFAEHDRELRLRYSKIAHALIVVLVPAGASLDWLLYPARLSEFLGLRLGVGAAAGVALALHQTGFVRRHIRWFAMLVPMLVNASISLMVYRSEGAASPYYAGLNLVLTGIGVLVPWNLTESALACVFTFGSYALACAAHGTLATASRQFLGNVYFLVLTGIICTTAAHARHRARVQEFRLSSELARSYQQVSELERLKTEFFANVSHELRTPLTLILSPLGNVGRRLAELPADLREPLEIARDNSLRLLRLVNELLEMSRLESGDVKLHPERLDVGEFASTQAESVQALARLKGLELRVERAPQALWVTADPAHLEKVLVNLLTNAIKFTPKGGRVTLSSRIAGSFALVEVIDTGIGIREANLPIIFERFRQADGSSHRRFSGVGLGLSMARELAEKQGGTLAATSRLGEGSTFTLSLPLGERGAAPAPERSMPDDVLVAQLHEADRFVIVADDESPSDTEVAPAHGRATVLVIDDEPDMRRYLAGILSDRYRVLKARDGVEGLALARKERPDLVLVDLMMPGIDGWEVCATLKSEPQEEAPKVVVVTARTDEMAKLSALKRGADDFMSKPFSTLEVRTRLANLLLAHELERNRRLQNIELKDTLGKLRAAEARLVEREKMEAGRTPGGRYPPRNQQSVELHAHRHQHCPRSRGQRRPRPRRDPRRRAGGHAAHQGHRRRSARVREPQSDRRAGGVRVSGSRQPGSALHGRRAPGRAHRMRDRAGLPRPRLQVADLAGADEPAPERRGGRSESLQRADTEHRHQGQPVARGDAGARARQRVGHPDRARGQGVRSISYHAQRRTGYGSWPEHLPRGDRGTRRGNSYSQRTRKLHGGGIRPPVAREGSGGMTSGYDYKKFALLFVDDEEQARKYFQMAFENDFRVLTASGVDAGWQIVDAADPPVGVVITDQRMPDKTGTELLGRVRRAHPEIVRLLATAYSDLGAAIDAVNGGAIFKYVVKPWDVRELRVTLRHAMEYFLLRRERDLLLREKLSSLQSLLVADRVKSLAILAEGLSTQVRNTMSALQAYVTLVREQSMAETRPSVSVEERWRNLQWETEDATGHLLKVVQGIAVATLEPHHDFSDRVPLTDLLEEGWNDARAAAGAGAFSSTRHRQRAPAPRLQPNDAEAHVRVPASHAAARRAAR